MVLCIVPSCWANGFYKLSDAISDRRAVLLWNRLKLFWKTGKISVVHIRWRCLVAADYLESYLASLFSLWPAGVAVAKSYLLGKTTHQKKYCCTSYIGNGLKTYRSLVSEIQPKKGKQFLIFTSCVN